MRIGVRKRRRPQSTHLRAVLEGGCLHLVQFALINIHDAVTSSQVVAFTVDCGCVIHMYEIFLNNVKIIVLAMILQCAASE